MLKETNKPAAKKEVLKDEALGEPALVSRSTS